MNNYGGHSMVAPLIKVLVCSPAAAGWNAPEQAAHWQESGFLHAPDFSAARNEHKALVDALSGAGAEVCFLEDMAEIGLDAVYSHDASFMTDGGAICLHMGKSQRSNEPAYHRLWYESAGIPVLGQIRSPGIAEAGDIVWLDPATLLVGRGYRTNASGIEQLRSLLATQNIAVLAAPLPHGGGPATCLHLMSLLSILDERTVLVDLPWLAVETVELLRDRGFRLIEIDYAERSSLACNVLALGSATLLAFEENRSTNCRLREAGFLVLTFPGSEIGINGGGGPTCLTRPVSRRFE
jgi:N-dimethylarginine dimethylaminohydrolase